MANGTCSIDGCEKPIKVKSRRLCNKHYTRWLRHGDPLYTRFIIGDDEARFWSYVDRGGDDECWPWTGAVTSTGYGEFSVGSRGVHRKVKPH